MVSFASSAQKVDDYTLNTAELGVTPSTIKGIEKAAKKGDLPAQRQLGRYYLNLGETDSINFKTSYKWFITAVIEHDDPVASFYLATMHRRGICKPFMKDVLKWARKSIGLYYRFYNYGRYDDRQIADEYFQKTINSGNAEALVLIGKRFQSHSPSDAIKYYKEAADKGNAEAQYYLGYCYFKGQGVDRNNKEARLWLNKALALNYSKAQNVLNDIVESERQDSIAQAQREEAERQRQAEAERQRQMALQRQREQQRQDSIDYAQGRKKAPYSFIIRNATTLSRQPDEKFRYLCANNMAGYFGRGNMDGLDKAAYQNSPQYEIDKRNFERNRNAVYAINKPLKDACKIEFEADGIRMRTYIGHKSFNGNYIDFGDFSNRFIIPLNINCKNGEFYLKVNDMQALLDVKAHYDSATLVVICKPSMFKEFVYIPYYKELQPTSEKERFCVVNPTAMYIVDITSDRILLDLSRYVKSLTSLTARQQFEAQIKNNNAAAQRGSYKKTYHQTPQRYTCWTCSGQGRVEGFDSNNRRAMVRCTACYGRGYIDEHYY